MCVHVVPLKKHLGGFPDKRFGRQLIELASPRAFFSLQSEAVENLPFLGAARPSGDHQAFRSYRAPPTMPFSEAEIEDLRTECAQRR